MTTNYNVSWQNGSAFTAIIAKDAGGAELLSSYILQYNKGQFIFYLTGPALEVFKRKHLICGDYIMSPKWNPGINYLIAAVSMQDDLSVALLKIAKEKKVPTEVIIDSWYNYSERFGYPNNKWERLLPDTLTICDKIANQIVLNQKLNKLCKIQIIENPYFGDVFDEYNRVQRNTEIAETDLLFLSSPLGEARKINLKELNGTITDSKDLLDDVYEICQSKGMAIRVRLHPTHKMNKSRLLENYRGKVFLCDYSNSLITDLLSAKYILGYCSTALVIASLLGKIAISFEKGDLADNFHWKEYGVYDHYGIKSCSNSSELRKIIN